jgi:hypothetical protein
MLLGDVMGLLPADFNLASISWSHKVYCTVNFTLTTAGSRRLQDHHLSSSQQSGGSSSSNGSSSAVSDGTAVPTAVAHSTISSAAGSSLAEYLRPVDALLVFPRTGEVLLLSEREADGVQEQIWNHRTTTAAAAAGRAVLVSLAFTQPPAAVATAAPRTGGPGYHGVMPAAVLRELVSVLLFNGCTSYTSGTQQVQQLQEMMTGNKACAEVLLSLRGKLALLSRSDLELSCDDTIPAV